MVDASEGLSENWIQFNANLSVHIRTCTCQKTSIANTPDKSTAIPVVFQIPSHSRMATNREPPPALPDAPYWLTRQVAMPAACWGTRLPIRTTHSTWWCTRLRYVLHHLTVHAAQTARPSPTGACGSNISISKYLHLHLHLRISPPPADGARGSDISIIII